MPDVSVIILTKNRPAFLKESLASVHWQSFNSYEVIVVNDGSTDETGKVLEDFKSVFNNYHVIYHEESHGITLSRQEALEAAQGEYVAFLDDDDEWVDEHKLEKQVKFLDDHPDYVLVGGGIEVKDHGLRIKDVRFRPETDESIRKWMLLKNCFFTSTVMFRREAALRAGGFIKDEQDFAEDYDLWLRLGKVGKMYNFQEVFTRYTPPSYSKEKFKAFLKKQQKLIQKHRDSYPNYPIANWLIKIRLYI